MDYIYNNMLLDEDIHIHCPYILLELTDEQREQLDNGQSVTLLGGFIVVNKPRGEEE